MHELSIVSSLVENVLNFVETQPVKRVIAVRLAIGELTCVEAEQIRFCYDLVTEGTAIAESVLEIEQIKASVRCLDCEFHGPPNYWDGGLSSVGIPTLQCPRCGHVVEAVEGNDCTIQSIKYVA